jgi:glycosyltransferase involved in cell wall biosynthesis
MSVYNGSAFLPMAVRSLQCQTLESWELVLIDDCSEDGSAEIAAGFADPRIRIFKNQTNLGLAASLNRAIRLAMAPFIARMDSDDICYPRRLENQSAFLTGHPDVSLVGGQAVMFCGNGVLRGLMSAPLSHEKISLGGILGGYPLYHPTWMGRAEWFLGNEYDPAFRKAQDYELLLRMSDTGTYANIPEVVLGYRHESNSLRKILRTRIFVGRAQIKNLLLRGQLYKFVLSFFVLLSKGAADIIFRIARSPKRQKLFLKEISKSDKAYWDKICENVGMIKDSD